MSTTPDVYSAEPIPEAARVGMGEYRRAAGAFNRVYAGAVACVGGINNHPKPVHLRQHLFAKSREAGIGVVAATSCVIAENIGKEHLPNAQCVIGRDHVDIAAKRICAFDVKTDGQFSL